MLYIAASVEQYCDITQVNALPENEGILETSTPIPSSIAVTVTDTGKSSAATYSGSGSTGIGGVTEPSTAAPTATQQFSQSDSGTTGTLTTSTSSKTDTLTETAREIGQQAGSRAAAEWQQRKQQVSEVAGNLRESASRTADQDRDITSRATYRVRRRGRQGVDAATTMISEHPLATAAVALGVGLLLGSMLGGQARRSQSYGYRNSDQDLDLGEYGSSRSYRSRDLESDYRQAEANAGYDRSGY
ncbi:DUF883 family protein [Skermanella pratensis]|uniref:DUF883 family protein n=1 Tax=Skermanella pratensis TaxID=2233999 RepID=UPI0013019865|nr:DUF883 family protein [Skermanella pratensis]